MALTDRYNSLKSIDLLRLTADQTRKFGFLIKNLAIDAAKSELYGRVTEEQLSDEIFASRYFGTPMWDNIILDTEDKKLRIDMVVISVSMSKNIVKTSIQGMTGTVKEYISDGDYTVNIKGGIFSDKESNAYPEDEVLTLIEILKKAETIRIESGFLNRLGIDDIVIEDYQLAASEGVRNAQFFDIGAVSDTPQELIFRI